MLDTARKSWLTKTTVSPSSLSSVSAEENCRPTTSGTSTCRSMRSSSGPEISHSRSTPSAVVVMSSALAIHGTTAAHGFMHASLSSSIRTWACALGSVNLRSGIGAAASSR